ncbi:MAG TPA: addiction module protein [Planctomycetaceae bacterium]|nr:addiction module protein [Planctomycetaceae bacterium]HQZ65736.1 addiction module protein [Planctomycetaceae bacterium]
MAIDIQELKNLPPDKKLQLVTMLWDDLRESGIPQLPPEEWEEIFRRDKYMTDHPEESLTTEQMWASVDELLKK